MSIRKMTLVAAALAVASLAPSAHAESYTVTGYNNGDEGFVGVTWGSPLTEGSSDSLNDGAVDARCEFHQQQAPGSNWAVLTVEGHAQAGLKGDVPAASVGVQCLMYDDDTNELIFQYQETTSGTAAVWLPPRTEVIDEPHAYRICTKTIVSWRNFTVTQNTTPACYRPSLIPEPPI